MISEIIVTPSEHTRADMTTVQQVKGLKILNRQLVAFHKVCPRMLQFFCYS